MLSSVQQQSTPPKTAKEAAEQVLVWAKKHNLFGKAPIDNAVEDETACFAQPATAFGAQDVETILREKTINLVSFDETKKKIIIFTNGKVTKAQEKILPFSSGGYSYEYIQGGLATVKGNPPPPENPAPFKTHNQCYTCGSSVYPANCVGAGTFGLLVKNDQDQLFGMTNNHVGGACNNAMPGLPILAPGPLDATEEACDPFTIGRHVKLLPINDGIPENIDISDNCDVSIFSISDVSCVTSMQGNSYDTPASITLPVSGSRVKKVGRTTGLTKGTILGQSASPIPVLYNVPEFNIRKTVFFQNVFIISGENEMPFSRPGDSGSLVVAEDSEGVLTAVGLVFAGNENRNLTFMLPLAEIMEKLSLEIVSGHNV